MVNKTRVLFHKEETGICAGLVKTENETLKVKLVLGKHITFNGSTLVQNPGLFRI